jgi:hypothetical protein
VRVVKELDSKSNGLCPREIQISSVSTSCFGKSPIFCWRYACIWGKIGFLTNVQPRAETVRILFRVYKKAN